jgi:hypothetical protein
MARIELTRLDLNTTTPRTAVAEVKTKILTDGVKIKNDGKTCFRLQNTDGSARTVTAQIAATLDGIAAATGKICSLDGSAGTAPKKYFGPFPTSLYNQTDGYIYLDASLTNVVDCTPVHIETAS